MSNDPIGTIRFENHDDDTGFSIWVKVGNPVPDPMTNEFVLEGVWLNIYSTCIGNHGVFVEDDIVEDQGLTEVIGFVPGTPADTRDLK